MRERGLGEPYVPYARTSFKVRNLRTSRWRNTPLFPGYLFWGVRPGIALATILDKCSAVRGAIRVAGEVVVVGDEVVDRVRAIEEMPRVKEPAIVRPGDRTLLLIEGRDVEAEVLWVTARDVVCLVDGRKMRVPIVMIGETG